MRKKLLEIYGLAEATPMKHAETELNMSTSVARSPKKYTPSTGKAQSDIDSAQSVVKKEAPMFGRPKKQASLEIDVAHDSLDDAQREARAAGIDFEIVEPEGPGGGNPLVKVTGDAQKVIKLLARWGYGEAEEI